MSQRSSAVRNVFSNAILKPIFWTLIDLCTGSFYIVDGDGGGGAADPGAGGADPAGGGDKGGGEKEISLRDELSANIEIQEKGPESTELSDAARRLASARKTAQQRQVAQADPAKAQADAKVKQEADAKVARDAELAKLAPEERAKREADEKAKADAAAAQKVEAPTSWSAADREMFAKQSPEARQWLLRRHGEMEKHFQKITQEAGPMRRMNEDLDEVFKPYDEEMRLSGVTRAQAIRELVGIHARMKKDPVEGLRYLAQISGVDLKKTIEGQAAADPAGESPTVKALRETVQGLEAKLSQFTAGHGAQQQNAQMSEITKFAEEKDAQGTALRPYFDEVAKDIAQMVRIARANGEPITLQDAYDRAIHANPATRQKVLAAATAEQRAKDEADRKAKAEAARKAAAANVEGEGAAASVAAKTGNVREDLEAAFATHGGRI